MSSKAPQANVEFSERMAGRLLVSEKTEGSFPLEFRITISIDNLDAFMAHKEDARANGTVLAPSLSAQPLIVKDGCMRLFVHAEDVFTYQMQYELPMVSEDGNKYMLVGHKNMSDQHGLNCFGGCTQSYIDTTRLTYYVCEGTNAKEGKRLGQGKLYISFIDCITMIISIRGNFGNKFKAFFVGNLAQIYFRAYLPKKTPLFDDEILPIQRELVAPAPTHHVVITEDGEELPVKRFQGGTRGVILCTHGLTVSDVIYTLDTVPKNFVEAMTEEGYDVWAANLRFGRLCKTKRDYNFDDVAMYDYPAIFDYIEKHTAQETRKGGIHVLCHCFGGHSFALAVSGGYVAPERVKSIVFNQLGFHVVPVFNNLWKSYIGIPFWMGVFGVKEYRATRDPERQFSDRVLDWFASYVVPIPFAFRTNSVEVARLGLQFNQLWENDMMDYTCCQRIAADFGTSHVCLVRHMVNFMRKGRAINAKGEDAYIAGMDQLAQIPTTFSYGLSNKAFKKQGMEKDLKLFREYAAKYGYKAPDGYGDLHMFVGHQNHGHMDNIIGITAYKTAYPDFIDHFAKWNTLEDRSFMTVSK